MCIESEMRGPSVNFEKSIIENRIKAIQELRTFGVKDLSIVHIEIFFTIFVKEEITRQDLVKYIPKISDATLKRYVIDLIHDHMLITEKECDRDSRLKHLSVSEKGLKLIELEIKRLRECLSLL